MVRPWSLLLSACAGALMAIGVLAAASVGLPLLAAGILLELWLVRSGAGGGWWAILAGAGLAILAVAVADLPYRPCGPGPIVATPRQPVVECGGVNPAVTFGVGGALLLASLAAAAARRR